MNKRIPLAAGLLWALGAQATDVPVPAAETAEPASSEQAERAERAACLQQTGSRIRTTEARPCINGPGQVITREQLDRTGATSVADAIRRSSASVH